MIRIRELRTAKGETMKALGQAMGVAESTISLYETGKRMPDVSMLLKLARYYGVTVDDLLGESSSTTGDDDTSSRLPTDHELKFALFGGDAEQISDEQLDEVKRYAHYLKERKSNGDKRPDQ